MIIHENHSLNHLNTLRVSAKAKYFVEINTANDFFKIMKTEIYKQEKKVILGGGSNILITKDINGLVIKNNIKGIETKKDTADHRIVKVGGGESRHDFVIYTCKNGLRGVENLVLIPGSVGAAPIQNIGAYGQEVKNTIINIKGFDLQTENIRLMNNLECEFDYRSSVFKTDLKDQFFITHVTFKLNKTPSPNLSYEKVKDTLANIGYTQDSDLTPLRVADAITQIRQSKLPSIDDIGTAGSFFKNPIVSKHTYDDLKKQFPKIIGRPASNHTKRNTMNHSNSDLTSHSELQGELSSAKERDNLGCESESKTKGSIKISAGQLLDLCGCKGMEEGNIGTYQNHALVIVNHGEPDGQKLRNFAKKLQLIVKEKTGVTIEPEVNII